MPARGFLVEIIHRTSSAVLFLAGELGGYVVMCLGAGLVAYTIEEEQNLATAPCSHMGFVS